jgi:hypothetical protein
MLQLVCTSSAEPVPQISKKIKEEPREQAH